MLLEIAPVTEARPLPSCTPSLMPFCISYTGPSPVSRYFRPRPAPPSLAVVSLQSSSSATLVASSSLSETKSGLGISSATSIGSLAHESECGEDELVSTPRLSIDVVNQAEQNTATRLGMDDATGIDSGTQPALGVVLPDDSSIWTGACATASRNSKRFVAAFRGRQMYGQGVDVPDGYGGLVLQAPLDPQGKDEEANKVKSQSRTRGATHRHTRRDDEDCGSDPDVDQPLPARKLVPLSTFPSFMLWTPDRPLDEGRDEYIKALVEWTRLAAQIHSYDE